MPASGFYNRPKSEEYAITSFDASMTQQHCEGEVDLNKLVDQHFNLKDPGYFRRLELSGLIKDPQQARYVDNTLVGALDYQEAMNIVRNANDRFALLPAKVRDYFSNDPSKYLDFVANINTPENQAIGVSLGIFEKKPHYDVAVTGPITAASVENPCAATVSGGSSETSA